MNPSQSDSLGTSVSERLIVAGERVLGDLGVEGASFRQISAQAGTRNNYAVQYHFTDMNGLIMAIVEKRTPEIEARRMAALSEFEAVGKADTRLLIEAFFKPLIEFVDQDRQPRFARFMLALHRAPDGWKPLDELFYMMPATERILDLLHVENSAIPAPVIWQRLRPISVMVLAYTCGGMHANLPRAAQDNIQDSLLDMAAAAMQVPVRENSATKLYGFVF